MSLTAPVSPDLVVAPPPTGTGGGPAPLRPRPSYLARRRLHRELVRRDRVAARLAELDAVRELLPRAAVLVRAGWVQDAWWSHRDAHGDLWISHSSRRPDGEVAGVCLVSSVREAGGDATSVVRRSLDLVWHTLHGEAGTTAHVPPPSIREMRVWDLTRWNDQPGRTGAEVAGLLEASARRTEQEMDRLRGSLPALAR